MTTAPASVKLSTGVIRFCPVEPKDRDRTGTAKTGTVLEKRAIKSRAAADFRTKDTGSILGRSWAANVLDIWEVSNISLLRDSQVKPFYGEDAEKS